jgi:hypothetical protein
LDVVQVEIAESGESVVVWVVVVPGEAGGVDKDCCGGEGVVVVDDVAVYGGL